MYSTSFTKEVFCFLRDNGLLNLGPNVSIFESEKMVTLVVKENEKEVASADDIECTTVIPKAFVPQNQMRKAVITGLIDKEVLSTLFATSKPFPSKNDKNLMMVSIEPKDSVQDIDSILGIKKAPVAKAVETHDESHEDKIFTDDDIENVM